MKKCPKCGREYRDYDHYCFHCNYRLEYIEGSKKMEWAPEATNDVPLPPVVVCPYCKSTNVKKISFFSQWGSFELYGFLSDKLGKQWECRKCGSYF